MDAVRRLASLARARARGDRNSGCASRSARMQVAVPAAVRGPGVRRRCSTLLQREVNVQRVEVGGVRRRPGARSGPSPISGRSASGTARRRPRRPPRPPGSTPTRSGRSRRAGRQWSRWTAAIRVSARGCGGEREVTSDWLVQSDGPVRGRARPGPDRRAPARRGWRGRWSIGSSGCGKDAGLRLHHPDRALRSTAPPELLARRAGARGVHPGRDPRPAAGGRITGRPPRTCEQQVDARRSRGDAIGIQRHDDVRPTRPAHRGTDRGMNKKQLTYFEKRLLEERARVMKELGYYDESVQRRRCRASDGDLSSYSFHMADQGTDAMEREKQFLFASQEGRYLWHVNQALSRLYNTPGEVRHVRAAAEAEITFERLDALPHARLCIELQGKGRGCQAPLSGGCSSARAARACSCSTRSPSSSPRPTSCGPPASRWSGEWFQLRLVYNQGAAFGLHLGPYSRWIFLGLAVGGRRACSTRMSATAAAGDRFRQLALGLVAGGAAGNLIDRIRSAPRRGGLPRLRDRQPPLADVQRRRHRRELRGRGARHLALDRGQPPAPPRSRVGPADGRPDGPAPRASRSSRTRTERLDRFLADQLQLSRTQAARLVADKRRARGRRGGARLAHSSSAATRSRSTLPDDEPPRHLLPADIPLTIVFEDEHLARHRQAGGAGGAPGPRPLGRHPRQRAGGARHHALGRGGGPARASCTGSTATPRA